MGPRLARRLFFAALLIALTALFAWLVLPRLGVALPWWVPVIGFAVIAASTVIAPALSHRPDDDDPEGPYPLQPDDDEGEGISAADRERFG